MRRTIPLHVAAVGLAVLLAACSGEASPETSTTSAVDTSTTLFGEGESVADLSDGSAMCDRVDQAAVEEVLGTLFEPPRVDSMAPTCALLAPDGIVYLRDLSEPGLDAEQAAVQFATDLEPVREVASSIDPVEDLGDEAYLVIAVDNPPFVMVRSGAEVLNIASEGIDADRLVAVARLVDL